MARESGPISYGEADVEVKKTKESIVAALLKAAKRAVQKTEGDRQKINPKHPDKFQPDVDRTMQRPPTKTEIEKQLIGELAGFKLPKEVTRDKAIVEALDLKLAEHEVKNPTMVQILRTDYPRDARSAQLAIEMLDSLDEQNANDVDALTKQVLGAAQDVWRYRVGSGYTNLAAEEAYTYLWEMQDQYYRVVAKEDPAKAAIFRREMNELIKSASYPPEIELTDFTKQQLGSAGDEIALVVDKINGKYRKYSINPQHPEYIGINPTPEEMTLAGLQQDLRDVEEAWKNNSGSNPTDEQRNAYKILVKQISERKKDIELILDEEEIVIDDNFVAGKIQTETQQARQEARQKEFDETIQTPSTFTPTQEEARDFINDPIGDLLQKMETIEKIAMDKSFEDPQLKTLYERYNLLMSFFLMDDFRKEKIKILEAGPNNEELVNNLRNKIDSFRAEQQTFVREFTSRFHAVQFAQAKSRAPNLGDQNFQGAVQKLNESDFVELPALYGGLVERANNIMTRLAIMAMRGEDGLTNGRLSEEKKSQVIKETAKYLREHADQFRDDYERYINGTLFASERGPGEGNDSSLLGAGSTGRTMTFEKSADAIARLAGIHKDLILDWENLELRGYMPSQSNQLTDEIPFQDKRSTFMTLKRRLRGDFEQWGGVDGRVLLDRQHHREEAKFWVKFYEHELHHDVEHETDHFIEAFQKAPISDLSDAHSLLMRKLKYFFFWNPDAYNWKDDDWIKLSHQLRNGEKRDLITEEMQVQFGIDIEDTHGVKAYTPFESKWRAEVFDGAVDAILGEFFPNSRKDKKDARKSLYTARDLVSIAKKHSMEKIQNHHASAGTIKEFHDKIIEVAQFRSHDLADMFLEKGDHDFIHQIHDSGQFHGNLSEILKDMGIMVSETNGILFQKMAKETDGKELPEYTPINFTKLFNDWSDQQRDAFRTVLKSMGKEGEIDTYVQRFKKLNEITTQEKMVKKLMGVRYEGLIAAAPRWTDDLPIYLLVKPERLQFLNAEQREKVQNLGKIIITSRSEANGLFKRNYGDLAKLEEGAKSYSAIPNATEQDLHKLLVPLFKPVAGIHGPEDGAIAQEVAQYAWSKMRAKRRLWAKSYNSTRLREYGGDQQADIVWPEEAQKLQEEMFLKTTNSNIHIAALMHTKESELRITAWGNIIEKVPGNPIKKFIFNMDPNATDSEKERRYNEFLHFLNDMYPSHILADKLVKTTATVLILAALFLFYQYVQEGMGATQSAGGSSSHGSSHSH